MSKKKQMNKQILLKRKGYFPQIYVYKEDRFTAYKIGYTAREEVLDRIWEQYPVILPMDKAPFEMVHHEDAIRDDGSYFVDTDIHNYLKLEGYEFKGEWFYCELEDIRAAILAIKMGIRNSEKRTESFGMRPEQKEAVRMTSDYFKSAKEEDEGNVPHFLWNAKMRFGKTFASYHLALEMGWTKVLVVTYKPAVEGAWKSDLLTHIDFAGWQFLANDAMSFDELDSSKPYVCFGSFQDLLGRTNGEIKEKNEWIHLTDWDCVIIDEYHFGAWREAARGVFQDEDESVAKMEDVVESTLPINAGAFLYLSGTPFRAIDAGEFKQEQIFNWTYADEQRAKAKWRGPGKNPYAALPKLILLTYELPDIIKEIAIKGEQNEFDLSYFFKATGYGEKAKFINENAVQKWLELIRGALPETTRDNIKLGAEKPPFPYDDIALMENLTHTLWLLPDVASCYAMANLLHKPHNTYYADFGIVVAAGHRAGIGINAIPPVRKAMGKNPLRTKTITLTCQKLTTGVTIKEWSGIFMLRNLNTPESYFQAAFRVQSPWEIMGDTEVEIVKSQCYVFDFDPNRALEQIARYANKLNPSKTTTLLEKVEEFIKYLPVLAYQGFAMEEVDAAGLLDIAQGRVTAGILASGWRNALLINVDHETLSNLAKNPEAMNAIRSIEGFRTAKEGLLFIIKKTKELEGLRTRKRDGTLTKKEKKKLNDEEKALRVNQGIVIDKLKTLASRIPIFMYLTDIREETLQDVITRIEPALFRRVTGLSVRDFDMLVELGLFNSNIMNNAVRKFREMEESSMAYSGINRHAGEEIGLFDMVIDEAEFQNMKEVRI